MQSDSGQVVGCVFVGGACRSRYFWAPLRGWTRCSSRCVSFCRRCVCARTLFPGSNGCLRLTVSSHLLALLASRVCLGVRGGCGVSGRSCTWFTPPWRASAFADSSSRTVASAVSNTSQSVSVPPMASLCVSSRWGRRGCSSLLEQHDLFDSSTCGACTPPRCRRIICHFHHVPNPILGSGTTREDVDSNICIRVRTIPCVVLFTSVHLSALCVS